MNFPKAAAISLEIVLVLGFAGALNPASARTCEQLFAIANDRVLSNELREIIHGMEDGDYRMAVERITVDGRPRTIVIAGERHIKSDEDTKRFIRLMQHFKFKATEGIQIEKYWMAHDLYQILQYERTAEHTDGSSLNTVKGETNARELEKEYEARILADIHAGRTDLASVTKIIDDGIFEKLERAKIDPQDHYGMAVIDQLDFQRVLQNVRAALANRSGRAPKNTFKTEVFPLEDGYDPKLDEKLAGAIVAWSKFIRTNPAALLTSCGMGAGLYCLTGDPVSFGAAGFTLLGFAGIGSNTTFDFAFDIFGALGRRDTHMTRTLLDILQANPHVDRVLVVVGKDHVPGMVRRLRKRGSTEVPFRSGIRITAE